MNTLERINPNTLTYNELRRTCKELKISSGLSSSPTKADLIKAIENHYKAQKPEITEKAKALKKETPELKSVPLKEIVETIAISNFQETLQKVKEFLKKTNEEKIILYKSLATSALKEITPATNDGLTEFLNNDADEDIAISYKLGDIANNTKRVVSGIISVEAVEDNSENELEKLATEVSNSMISDDEQALIDSLLSNSFDEDEDEDENED